MHTKIIYFGDRLSSKPFALIVLLLFAGLPISYFILPTGYLRDTIALSFINTIIFLLFFGFGYVSAAFHLSFNEWVYEVEDMSFWFNPSFMTWLFAKHRERWVKWATMFSLLCALIFGFVPFMVISAGHITQETFLLIASPGIVVTSLFALAFYKVCVS